MAPVIVQQKSVAEALARITHEKPWLARTMNVVVPGSSPSCHQLALPPLGLTSQPFPYQ
jgi:hypothetical protein